MRRGGGAVVCDGEGEARGALLRQGPWRRAGDWAGEANGAEVGAVLLLGCGCAIWGFSTGGAPWPRVRSSLYQRLRDGKSTQLATQECAQECGCF